MPASNSFSITQLTKDRVPTLPFSRMKEKVLGKNYTLSLVIVGDKRSKNLNETYRKKSYTPNVLSFPLDKKNGEIFLNLKQAKREYKKRNESFEYFVALLFIHSMFHLKGFDHSATMEDKEQKILSAFKIKNITK